MYEPCYIIIAYWIEWILEYATSYCAAFSLTHTHFPLPFPKLLSALHTVAILLLFLIRFHFLERHFPAVSNVGGGGGSGGDGDLHSIQNTDA